MLGLAIKDATKYSMTLSNPTKKKKVIILKVHTKMIGSCRHLISSNFTKIKSTQGIVIIIILNFPTELIKFEVNIL